MPPAFTRYELGALLGQGAMGQVYAATDRVLGREVAIKVLSQPLDDVGRRRLVREAQLAAGFRHASAIEVFELIEEHGVTALVMERVRAPSLAVVLAAQGTLPVAEVRAIGIGLADALAAAHAAGLVHRDVKPGNVFVDGELASGGRVRLADFGLAFQASADRETLGRLTREGVTLGTPMYMSPEQIEGAELGPPTDIYALAAMLYELAAGRPPFVGDTVPIVFAGHLYLPPIPLTELALSAPVPVWLDELLRDGLAKAASARPDATTFAARLRAGEREARGGRSRPLAADQEARPALPAGLRVWTLDQAMIDALRAAGIELGRPAHVELRVIEGELPPAAASVPVIALHSRPTSAMLASAIRLGYHAVVRWPGPLEPLLRVLGRMSAEIPVA